jgi:addiction module HigA family antidote
MGLTVSGFARRLGTTPANLSRIVNGRQAISAEMAYRLCRALGTSYQFWLNLQDSHDLARIGRDRLARIDREVEPLPGAA